MGLLAGNWNLYLQELRVQTAPVLCLREFRFIWSVFWCWGMGLIMFTGCFWFFLLSIYTVFAGYVFLREKHEWERGRCLCGNKMGHKIQFEQDIKVKITLLILEVCFELLSKFENWTIESPTFEKCLILLPLLTGSTCGNYYE